MRRSLPARPCPAAGERGESSWSALKLGALLMAMILPACAHMEAPPGGPADTQGPRLLTTRPDTMARLESFPGPVVLVFDEGLSEERVEEAVEVSPRTSALSVEKRGDEIRVDLRRGWERGRVYQVTVEPIVRDRFNNQIVAPVRLVFSTGPEIPDTRMAGRVIDRQTAAPAQRVRVEAILSPDSLVYATRTDSAGAFLFQRIPTGTYVVRAFSDPNANRALEEGEARDTTTVTLAGDSLSALAFSIVRPDTSAPRVTSAQAEGTTITVRFDDYLDPLQPDARVRVFGPDSAEVQVAEWAVGALAMATDSAAADSTAARAPADSARSDSVRADSARPVPAQTLMVRLTLPLASEASYRVTIDGVRNLVGLLGGGTVQFRSPRLRAPATPARADSAAAPVQADTALVQADTAPAPAEPAPAPPRPEPSDPPPEGRPAAENPGRRR